MKSINIHIDPEKIFEEYKNGDTYKQGLGKKGLTEQGKINERFFVGDHWHGANCGNTRPLVRRNIIKRIGEFKMSAISAAPVAAKYTAEGIPDVNITEEKNAIEAQLASGESLSGNVSNAEISSIMHCLSEYFKVTAERLRLDILKERALRNCYISGTGVLYTYWDKTIKTGLYADEAKQTPVTGDINCEVIDIENIVFGEPNNEDIQSQPYIIISRRRHIGEVIREAGRNRIPTEQIAEIKPDNAGYYTQNQGYMGEQEPSDSQRVTTMTKFYKKWDDEGGSYKVMCVECTEKTIIRRPFDIGITYYPLAIMPWERRRSNIYGESEITYLVPNQIAINRCLTAAVWGMIATGMPITLVNGDVVTEQITNEPGQIIKVYGDMNDVAGAIRHVQPPIFQTQYFQNIGEMANSTLSDSGATDAALGSRWTENASAIIQMREAALQPMQIYMNRFYDFIEQLARIWADFWINFYGHRMIRTVTKEGTNYIPFDGERYKNLVITARVDVGASTLWSEAVVISTLDNLLGRELITFAQYLDRMPSGVIPDVEGLKKDLQIIEEEVQTKEALSDEAILQDFAAQQPELFAQYQKMPPEQQKAMLAKIRGAYNGGMPEETQGE